MKQTFVNGPKFFVLCILVLAITSCAKHYVKPKAPAVNPDHVLAFTCEKTFKVINDQPSKEDKAVGRSGIGTFYVALHTFTEEAARLLTEELTKRGMRPAVDAEKVIRLAVTDIKIFDRFSYNCILEMDVDINNDYRHSFKANNVSPHGGKVWGGAITTMVTEVLNEDGFVDCIKK